MPIVIATVYSNKKSQLIEIPHEARLPDEVKKIAVRIRGNKRIITPIQNTWENFFQNGPSVTDDFFG
jgi:antitoxin VapB